MGAFEDFRQAATRRVYKGVTSSASSGSKSMLTHALKLNASFGLLISSAVLVFWDISDYRLEKKKLAQEYSQELGARLNKSPDQVTAKDLETVAADNPTLGEAVHRSKLKRNLHITSNLLGTVAGFAAATFLFASTGGIGMAVLAALVGFVSYMATDAAAGAIGRRMLHLKEPKVKDVEKNPSLQPELSMPSQVKFIEWMQDRRLEIAPEHVAILLNKANPGADIPVEQTEQLAQDLNDRLVNAQELAFIAYGQTSGVPKREIPERSALEMANQRIAEQTQVIREQAAKLGDRASEFGSAAKEKASEFKERAGEWTSRIMPKKQPQDIINEKIAQGPQSAADTVLNQRQQQAEQPAGLGV
ncbi:MAG TPA: hypothetical protein VFT64_11025 [Rickettsiales bacterium]|nr:hypothetical protein [Rickettsiales bacterium]